MDVEPDGRHRVMAKVASDIEREGWTAIGVFGTEDSPMPTNFTYSVGLTDLGVSEVIVLGLPAKFGHALIGDIYKRTEAGEPVEAGEFYDGLLSGGYKVTFVPVPPPGRPLNLALAYYDVDEIDALQLVWPDEAGLFPGDPACDPRFVAAQDLASVLD